MNKQEIERMIYKVGGESNWITILEEFLKHSEISNSIAGRHTREVLDQGIDLYDFFKPEIEYPDQPALSSGFYFYIRPHTPKPVKQSFFQRHFGKKQRAESHSSQPQFEITFGYSAGGCAGEGFILLFYKDESGHYHPSPNPYLGSIIH